MSKTDLQSTTHGGGRVLSVILAGTLAMGMTPAVALTSQSLEPVQAFAAEGDPWSGVTVDVTGGDDLVFDNQAHELTIALTGVTDTSTIKSVTIGTETLTAESDGSYKTSVTAAGNYKITATSTTGEVAAENVYVAPATATFAFDSSKVAENLLKGKVLTEGALSDGELKTALQSAMAVTQTVEPTSGELTGPVGGLTYGFSVAGEADGKQVITCTATIPEGSNYAFVKDGAPTLSASSSVNYTVEATEAPAPVYSTINASQAVSFKDLTITGIAYSGEGVSYTGQDTENAPLSTELTVTGTYEVSAGTTVPVSINLDGNFSINLVPVEEDGSDGEPVASVANAGSYKVQVNITSADGKTTYATYTTDEAIYTIAPAVLSIENTGVVANGDGAEAAKAAFTVAGVQAGDENVYTITLGGEGWSEKDGAIAGKTITATIEKTDVEPTASNYAVPEEAKTAETTVLDAVTIADEIYAVELKETGAINETAGAEGFFKTYSYNGVKQAPEVVITNTNPASQNKKPVEGTYQVLYGAYDSTTKTYATGSTEVPTAVGKYQISVRVGAGSTATTTVIGYYEIDQANINDANEVKIYWNGLAVANGADVTMNNAAQYNTALKLVYPSSNVVIASGVDYSVALNTAAATLIINASGSNAATPLTGDAVTLNYTLANYQIGSASMKAAFTKDPIYYTGKAVPAGAGDVEVKNIYGEVVPQQSVYYATDGVNFVNPSDKDASANGTSETVTLPNGDAETRTYKLMDNWVAVATNNTNAGEAVVTITGTGNYAGEAIANFTIRPCDVSKLQLTLPYTSVEYNAKEQTPNVTVTAGTSGVVGEGETVFSDTVAAKDNPSELFSVSYTNNVNASNGTNTAVATITAVSSNFVGSQDIKFTITPYDLEKHETTLAAANQKWTANGIAYPANIVDIKSGLTVNGAAVPMTEGADYTVIQNTTSAESETSYNSWSNIDIPATATSGKDAQQVVYYAVTGKGNYKGTIYNSYYVTKNELTTAIKQLDVPNVWFNGRDQKPHFGVILANTETSITDTEAKSKLGLVITYGNNRNASSNATITLTPSGLAEGGIAYWDDLDTYYFTIRASDLTGATFGILLPENADEFTYTGSQITPSVSTDKDDVRLYSGAPGVLTTKRGDTIYFEDIEGEYTVSYGENLNVGNGTVIITSNTGNMTNSATQTFAIKKATITKLDVVASESGVYKTQADGSDYAEPEVVVTVNGRTLVRGVDYTLTVTKQQTIGSLASFTVEGIGNYQGIVPGTFMVVNDIANADIEMPDTTYVYDGTEKKPEPVITYKNGNETITLKLGADYTLDYVDNVDAGTATMIITGKGNSWGGTVEKTFTIEQAKGTLSVAAAPDYVYTGEAATPEPDFTLTVGNVIYTKADLEAGVDYKYVYANNVESSAVSGKKATVSVEMLGNYGAENDATVEFSIAQADVAKAEVVVGDVVKGGTPKVAVSMDGRTLVKGTDYTFSADTKTVGTKIATITGKGNYTGTQKVAFTVLNENQVPADPDQPITGTGWKKDASGKWQYVDANGKIVSSGWQSINGKWYHFDSKGYAETGWQQIGGAWYYLYTAADAGKTECSMVTGWAFVDGHWFYFAPSGAMQTGWQQIGGAWYYLNTQHDGTFGAMKTGWQWIDNNWFYFAASGAMQTGWQSINGAWYLLNTQHDGTFGAMLTGWQRVNHATGAPTTANTWYYLTPGSGALATNTWIGNYYVDSTGYWAY